MKEPRSAENEAKAQELAQAIAEAAQQELLEVARILVDSDPATLFGQTEFAIRKIILKIAAQTYQQHLAGKKTATRVPA
jgi:hypothetical protein